MYIPSHFEETRVEELHRIIDEYPLGVLVTNGPNGLDANHLPFEFEPGSGHHGELLAHVARANPIWKESKDGDQVLVIFHGGEAYISPNWYPSKHESHRQVPTWNYQVVHVHGNIRIRQDREFLIDIVARLTHKYEARAGEAKPWKMSDASKDYIDAMLQAIIGVQIQINRIVGKSKLSQNRETRDRISAANELQKRGEQQISAAMQKLISHVLP